MKEKISKKLVGILIAATLLATFMPNIAHASSGLELEISHTWTTDAASYSNAVAAGDIDADGAKEIATVGYFRNSTTGYNDGELNIWSWNGTNLNSEHSEYFYPETTSSNDTSLNAVTLGNVDNEIDTEIIVAGQGNFMFIISLFPPKIVFQEQGMIFLGGWNGSTFTIKDSAIWPSNYTQKAKFLDVAIGDLDKDNATEIVAVGTINATTGSVTGFHGALTIWSVDSSGLTLEESYIKTITGGETIWNAVSINDVDNDGDLEIVIVGDFYDTHLNHRCSTIRICTWDGSTLNWETSSEWFTYGNTYVSDVAISDIDLDGIKEIITSGYHQTGETLNAQLRVWTWYREVLTLKLNIEGGLVEPPIPLFTTALAVGDIDADGKDEIILGINAILFLATLAHIRILAWENGTLVTKDYRNWEKISTVQGITTSDVDADGNIEVLTVGSSWELVVKSELTIWSVSKVASSITVNVSPPSIVIGSQVTISGILTNEVGDTPIPNAEVTIEFSREPLPVLVTIGKAVTNENGEYMFTWIPPAAGNYMIRVSWKGDYEHEAAAATTTLTVEKASSLIALTLSSYTAKVGDSIGLSGTLYPAKAAAITLRYMKPDSTISTKTVYSNQAGVFTDTFTVDQAGQWQITASWSGDDTYKAAESTLAPLTVTKIQSILAITASQLTVNVGEEITINGALTPGQTANITLTYTMPNGTSTTKTVQSNSTGAFTDTIKLEKAGTWQVKASWTGNAQHAEAESTSITLTAQAVDTTTPMFALGGLGLGIVALILAAIALLMPSRKPKAVPPTQPTQPPQQ
ncbi:MAG: carboxypeptidase regulatory-like domain-containing protein [Candidatus Bathyarchaeia archaeon]